MYTPYKGGFLIVYDGFRIKARPDCPFSLIINGLENLNLIKAQSIEPELEYIFKHALTQDVVYNGLLKKERQEIHERIGLAIEKLFAGRITEFYEILAYHFKKGHSKGKAVAYFMEAGNKSLAKFAFEEANLFFKQADDLLLASYQNLPDWENTLIELLNRWSFVLSERSGRFPAVEVPRPARREAGSQGHWPRSTDFAMASPWRPRLG